MDERPHLACCQFADAEQLAHDPDLFDCESCRVADAVEGLDQENAAAWSLYQMVASRFVTEAGVAPLVLERHLSELPLEDFTDTLERLGVVHDILAPRRTETKD